MSYTDQLVADLVAREAIRTLVHTYNDHGDRGRLDDLVALFTEDAVLDVAGGTYVGHDEILGFYRGLTSSRAESPGTTFVRHHVANILITLEPDGTASGSSYWAVFSDDGFESSGRYRDRYRQGNDGQWRFSHRTIRRDEPRTAR